MIELPKQLLFMSLVVSVAIAAFVYYSMRNRVNQLENDMNSMFNLVSSLNDEQKKLGNLVVYSIQQQEYTNNKNNDAQDTQNIVVVNEDEPKLSNLTDYENNSDLLIPSADVEPNVDYLSFHNQDDLRVVVSDDETDNHVESDDVNEDTETDVAAQFNKFNKMKVNELKNVLDTLTISKSEIVKAKKLKKTQLVEFIVKNITGILDVDGAKYTSDEDDVEKDDDADDDSDDALSDTLEDDNDELIVDVNAEHTSTLNDIDDK